MPYIVRVGFDLLLSTQRSVNVDANSNSFEGMMLTPPDHGLPDQDVVEWAFGKTPSSSDFRKFNGGGNNPLRFSQLKYSNCR